MSSTDFLTTGDLKDLTGYSVKSKQAEWLKRNAWTFYIGGDLRPRVAREHYAVKMGFRPAPETMQSARSYAINAEGLRALGR